MAASYREVVIEGPRYRSRAFIDGFLAGRGVLAGPLLEAEEEGFEVETLRERLREAIHPLTEAAHLLVPESATTSVSEAVAAAAERGIAARIVAEHAILGARFAFSVDAYSEEHARRIRGWFERLPDGVRLVPGTGFREERDPSARGDEAYAPVHEYEVHGEGGVEGDVEGVLSLLRLCREEELVRTRRAVLLRTV